MKNNTYEIQSLKTIGIIIIAAFSIMIIFGILVLVSFPKDIFNKEINTTIYSNLPVTYKIFLDLIFNKTNIFSIFLILVSVFSIFAACIFIKKKMWAKAYIEKLSWIIVIIIFIYWVSFLYFIFNVNSIIPDLNLKQTNLIIYKIFGFIISFIHLIIIIPIFRLIRWLRKIDVKELFN